MALSQNQVLRLAAVCSLLKDDTLGNAAAIKKVAGAVTADQYARMKNSQDKENNEKYFTTRFNTSASRGKQYQDFVMEILALFKKLEE